MKIFRTPLSLLLALTLPGTLYAQSELTDGLIAHLPLDGDIVDVVSGAKPTVLEGTGRVEGKIGGAIQFDAKSYVQLPIDISPQAVPELTITMWVRPDPLPDDPELAFNSLGYLLSDGDGLIMITNQQKPIPYFEAYSTGTAVHGSNNPGMRGGWQLLAITRTIEDRTTDDGEMLPHTVLTLYSNGRVSEAARIHKDISILPYISLGRKSKGHSYVYRGAIDDIRVYARAMTPDEIRASAMPSSDVPIAGTRAGDMLEGTGPPPMPYGGPMDIGIDATSLTPGADEADGASASDIVPGSDSSSMDEPPERFGQPPSAETLAERFADSGSQQDAINDIAIDNSTLGGNVSGPSIDAGAIDQGTEFEAPPIVTDERADATPVAGAGAIGASDPAFEAPVQGADDAQDLVASAEGQDLLQSADWRIEGMVPNSADKAPLYPGDEVTVKIRISKDDPANKIPSVRLVADAGPGVPNPTYDLTINTAAAKPTDEREVPITLPVPANLEFADGATQTYWRPRIWLNAADGLPLIDSTSDNHTRDLLIPVENPEVSAECGERIQNSDGTYTTTQCLISQAPPQALNSWSSTDEDVKDCRSSAEFMGDLWQGMDSVLLVACASAATVYEQNTTIGEKFRKCTSANEAITPFATFTYGQSVTRAVQYFNRLANNSWATLGPRDLTFGQQLSGTVVFPGNRKFVSVVPSRSDAVALSINELDGKARVEVAVCRRDESGRFSRLVAPTTFNYNEVSSNRAQNETFVIGGVRDKFLAVVLTSRYNDAIARTNVAPKFEYTLSLEEMTH
jgi:hypothetical protein